MITQVYSQMVASDLKIALMDVLPDEYEIYFLRNLGLPDEECRPIKLFELDRQPNIDHLTSAYIPPMAEGAEDTVFEKVDDVEAVPGIITFGDDEDDFAEEGEEEGYAEDFLPEAGFDDFDIQPLADVMRTLREPGGCPWDRDADFLSYSSKN